MKRIINKLVKLANHLDEKGLTREADAIDKIVTAQLQRDEIKSAIHLVTDKVLSQLQYRLPSWKHTIKDAAYEESIILSKISKNPPYGVLITWRISSPPYDGPATIRIGAVLQSVLESKDGDLERLMNIITPIEDIRTTAPALWEVAYLFGKRLEEVAPLLETFEQAVAFKSNLTL